MIACDVSPVAMFVFEGVFACLAGTARSFSLIQCVVSSPVSRHRSWSRGQVSRQLLVCTLSSNSTTTVACLQRSTTLLCTSTTLIPGPLHWASLSPCALSPCSQAPFGDRSLGEAANTIFRGFPFKARQHLSPLHQLLPLPLQRPPLPVLEKQPVPSN